MYKSDLGAILSWPFVSFSVHCQAHEGEEGAVFLSICLIFHSVSCRSVCAWWSSTLGPSVSCCPPPWVEEWAEIRTSFFAHCHCGCEFMWVCLHVLLKCFFSVLLVTDFILLSLTAELMNWPKIFGQKNKKFGFRRNSLEGHNRRLKQSCLISTCQMVHFDRVRVYHTLMNSSYKETGLLGHFVCLKIASWDIMSYIWFV